MTFITWVASIVSSQGGNHISVQLPETGAAAGTTIYVLVGGLTNPAAAGTLRVCDLSTSIGGRREEGNTGRIIDAADEASSALP